MLPVPHDPRTVTNARAATVPVRVSPVLDAKPWGGRRLAQWGIALPPGEAIGEAHLAAPDAMVVTGALQGRTLGELARGDPASWVGPQGLRATGGRSIFPLLIKLITSETHLSIQVHPDDRAALAAGIGTGKTEAYHILDADPGSVLYLGLLPGVAMSEFREACRREDGSAAALMRQTPVRPGMTMLIPAGAAHAPGAGITLYEIQQPSNVTFRLDDWGRTDEDGQRRTLHHEAGFGVLDPGLRPEPVPRVGAPVWPAGRELLVATPFFALEKVRPTSGVATEFPETGSPTVLTCLAGQARVEAGTQTVEFGRGMSVVVPVDCATRLQSKMGAVVLRGWVPDLAREIVAPLRAAAVSEQVLQGLGAYLSLE